MIAHDLIECGQPLFLAKTMALRLDWVFDHLLAHPGLTAEDRPALEHSVAGVRNGLDFADALHHASCRCCEAIASFDDRGFVRRSHKLNLAPRVFVPAGY